MAAGFTNVQRVKAAAPKRSVGGLYMSIRRFAPGYGSASREMRWLSEWLNA
jgi:hypothetical protein